ncbi:hypothetical protein BJ508DRAFT_366632 [Ascobolus immersus RN42]|uniref:Distal membrane-arm assembly complex protein 1-like domain-containing protein n=1 Tax=Ascobolus immersus RN42 TaxID=1160509 RepID=A0A3N4HMA8_ASCIM|nr:hypothetical protein BJ508DRAFT_366632 [Ascobolus immersus RN42]
MTTSPSPAAGSKEAPNPQDCMPCKVIGGTAFLGLGTYTLISGLSQLREERSKLSPAELAAQKFSQRAGFMARRMGIWGIGVGLIGAGTYRFLQ